MKIKDNVKQILEEISNTAVKCGRNAEDITLIAVTKTVGVNEIKELIDNKIFNLGENRVQVLQEKQKLLTEVSDIKWHMIGHLQRNKIKYIIDYIHMIHSVDSIRLIKEINKQAVKNKRTIDILLQFNTSAEESKYGFNSTTNLNELFETVNPLTNINITGLMCMAPFTENKKNITESFVKLRQLKEKINENNLYTNKLKHLSMGMSNDYKIAIKEGSTFLRIGTKLFI